MSFLTDYFDLVEGTGEQAVNCPFDHQTSTGTPYKESHASAHVNTDDQVFHCKACDRGFNEVQFIQQITGCSEIDSYKIQKIFATDEDLQEWEMSTQLTEVSHELAIKLGFSEEVIKELKIVGPPKGENSIAYPVFMYGHLCDIRIYTPGGTPKVRSRLR